MHDNTYKSLVEVEILLHSVLVVDSCDIPLVLYLFQILLLLLLCLCSQLNPLTARYTEVPSYIVWYCSGDELCHTVVALCYMVVAQYYNVVAECCMWMVLS
jgi:hypothetical protein